MAGFGFFIQLLALFAGAAAILFYISAIRGGEGTSQRYFKIANWATIVQCGFVVVASIVLLIALVTGDFSIAYVAGYTDRSLPMLYKLSAFWAGQAGSLMFWGLLLAIIAVVEIFRIKKLDLKYQSWVIITVAVNTTFFVFLCTFVTPLFETLPFTPRDGNGMNPMLQNPGMLIHPPLIFIGFAGFAVPFGHSLASFFTKNLGGDWVINSRQWTLFTWVFLAAGVVIGGWWAYAELGWGGYWAWDPVENASLFPWLTSTAMLHAMIMHERKGRLKSWAHFMTMITFWLTIFATFLTRSGIISDSVHTFGQSSLGPFFVVFMLATFVIFFIGYIPNRKELQDKEEFNFLSREGVFFVAMLVFSGLTFAILFYTMLPAFTELFYQKFTVELSAYNNVSIPFFIIMLFLAGLAPIISYGKMSIDKLAKAYIPVAIFAAAVTAITVAMGFRHPAGIILTFVTGTSLAAFMLWTYNLIKNGGPAKIIDNRRAFGAIIVHVGLVMMAYGIIFSAFYHRDIDVTVTPNSTVEFERYTVHVDTVYSERIHNYVSNFVPLALHVGDKHIANLYPEIRQYEQNLRRGEDRVFAEVAYHSMPRGDFYVILSGYDMGQNMIRLAFYIQPLLIWIWVGCLFMCVGGLYGMTQNAPVNSPLPLGKKEEESGKAKKKK